MERIDINKKYELYEISEITHQNRNEIGTLPIYEPYVDKYVLLISYYSFNEQQEKIFKSLNKSQKLGMLNRHVLSVARQLNISNILIKMAKQTTKDLASINKNVKLGLDYYETHYKTQENNYRRKLVDFYTLILDMIMEETTKRMNVKYMRKKKLEEITQSSSN